MAKVQVELDSYELEHILNGMEQAFLRYEEVAKSVIAECKNPEPLYIKRLTESMEKFHNVSVKVGEALKGFPYIDGKAVDEVVDMRGWERRINKIRKLLEEKGK